jgi:hypothetical protein
MIEQLSMEQTPVTKGGNMGLLRDGHNRRRIKAKSILPENCG